MVENTIIKKLQKKKKKQEQIVKYVQVLKLTETSCIVTICGLNLSATLNMFFLYFFQLLAKQSSKINRQISLNQTLIADSVQYKVYYVRKEIYCLNQNKIGGGTKIKKK